VYWNFKKQLCKKFLELLEPWNSERVAHKQRVYKNLQATEDWMIWLQSGNFTSKRQGFR
jgi:hypothetical protein